MKDEICSCLQPSAFNLQLFLCASAQQEDQKQDWQRYPEKPKQNVTRGA